MSISRDDYLLHIAAKSVLTEQTGARPALMTVLSDPIVWLAFLFAFVILANFFYRRNEEKKKEAEREAKKAEAEKAKAEKAEKAAAAEQAKAEKAAAVEQAKAEKADQAKKGPKASLRKLGDSRAKCSNMHSMEMLDQISQGKNPVTGKSLQKMADLQKHLSFAAAALEQDLASAIWETSGEEIRVADLHSLTMLKSIVDGVNPITKEAFTSKSELQTFVAFATKALQKDLGECEKEGASSPKRPPVQVMHEKSYGKPSTHKGTRERATELTDDFQMSLPSA